MLVRRRRRRRRRKCIEIPNARNKQEAYLDQGADKERSILQAMAKVVQPEDVGGVSLAHQKEGGKEKKKRKTRKVLQRLAYKDADSSVSIDVGSSKEARERRVSSHKADNEDYIRDIDAAISVDIAEDECRTRRNSERGRRRRRKSRANRWTSENLRVVRRSALKERIISCTFAERHKVVEK